jgi:hypothetical protein
MSAVMDQIARAGYSQFVQDYVEHGDTLLGNVDLELIDRLHHDPRFASGVFYGFHRDVGGDLIDFRSYNGELGEGSLQLVIDRFTGAIYADIDRFNPYQDVVRIFGHLFREVLPGFFRRRKRTWRT